MGTACSYFLLIRVLTRFLLLACEVVRLVGFLRLKPIKKAERCFATPFRTSKNILLRRTRMRCKGTHYLRHLRIFTILLIFFDNST